MCKTEPKNSGTRSSNKNAHPRDTDQQQILTDCVYVPLLSNALTNVQSPCTAGETNYHSNWWRWGCFVILYNVIYQYTQIEHGDFLISYLLRLHHVKLDITDVTLNKQLPAHHPCHRSWGWKSKQGMKESQQEHELQRGPLSHSLSTGEPSLWHRGNHLMTFTGTSGLESGLNSIWREGSQSADKASTWYHEPN